MTMTTETSPPHDAPSADGRNPSPGRRQTTHPALPGEGRPKIDPGKRYYLTAIQHHVPMVFCWHDGHHQAGIIAKDGKYTFTLTTTEGRRVVDKTDLQFAYRARSHQGVSQAIRLDKGIRRQKNPPFKAPADRYRIPDAALQQCQASGNWLRLTLRGGEILEGQIEWVGRYDSIERSLCCYPIPKARITGGSHGWASKFCNRRSQ